MEFKEIQKKIVERAKDYEERYNLVIDENTAIIKLYEEVGEFAEAVLTHRKKSRPEKLLPPEESKNKVSEELADVIGMAVVTADRLGIDIEKALQNKWINRKNG